jgi:hypothetical protein
VMRIASERRRWAAPRPEEGCREGASLRPPLPATALRSHPCPSYSLLLTCRGDEVKAKFERYGPIRDVYLPKDFCE